MMRGTIVALCALAVLTGAVFGAHAQGRAGRVAPLGRPLTVPQPSAQQPTPPSPPAQTAPQPARIGGAGAPGDCAATVTQSSSLVGSQRVTLDYLRMHDPDVVAAMAASVRRGELPRAALTGLGSPELIDRMVDADWTTVERARDTAPGAPSDTLSAVPRALSVGCPTAAPTIMSGPRDRLSAETERAMIVPPGREARDRPAAAAVSVYGQMGFIDLPKAQVDMGTVLVGERRRASFRVISLIDGDLSAKPAPGSLVRVIAITPVDGLVAHGAQGLDQGQSSPSPAPGAPRRAGLPLRPWAYLQAGQAAVVLVEFTPSETDGFDGSAKPYQTSLVVAVTASDAPGTGLGSVRDLASHSDTAPAENPTAARTVALNATVAGKLYGIGLSVDEPEVFANPRMTFDVAFDLYNNGVAGDATVSVDPATLPTGVTLANPSSATVHLDAGEEKQWVTLTLNGPPNDIDGPNLWNVRPENDPVMVLTVTQASAQGGQTTRYPISVHLGEVQAIWHKKDWVRIEHRANVYHGFYIMELSTGDYLYYVKLGDNNYEVDGSCYEYDDGTTVAIDNYNVYSFRGKFNHSTSGAIHYFRSGRSGMLASDFGGTVAAFRTSYSVTCKY